MKFEELDLIWKTLIIIGILFIIIALGLIVFIILVFKTDLISLDLILASKDVDKKYQDFIDELDLENIEEPVKDPVKESFQEPVKEPVEEIPKKRKKKKKNKKNKENLVEEKNI